MTGLTLDRRTTADIGAHIGFAGALIWMVFGMESILHPTPNETRDAVWFLPGSLTWITLWLVHRVQRAPALKLERLCFAFLFACSALVFVVVVGLVCGIPALVNFTGPVGILSWIVGMAVYGVATWKAGVLPRWVALAIILFEPGSVATGLALSPIAPIHDRGGYSAGVEKAVALAIIAYGLRRLVRNRATAWPSESDRRAAQ